MISVDQRTRTAADEQSVDPSEFFDQTLPARFDANTALAAPGARELDLRPIAVEVDGTIWQLAFDGQHFTVGRAHDAATAVPIPLKRRKERGPLEPPRRLSMPCRWSKASIYRRMRISRPIGKL